MLNMQDSVSGDKNVILISKQQEIAIKCEKRVTYTYHMPSLFNKNILSLDLASGNNIIKMHGGYYRQAGQLMPSFNRKYQIWKLALIALVSLNAATKKNSTDLEKLNICGRIRGF